MTGNTQKLDVETLKYVLSMIRTESERYGSIADTLAECGYDYDADRFDAKRLAMNNFRWIIRGLIREQQEA